MSEPKPPLVPDDFAVPEGLDTEHFVLRPLGPEHNESDHAAWSSSIDHIRSTPGFPDGDWPHPMTLEQNLGDLVRHRRHFDDRVGFTYTVLDPADHDRVIGCLYIYPDTDAGTDADVRSWVTEQHADLDVVLWQTVSDWLAAAWPFETVAYAERERNG